MQECHKKIAPAKQKYDCDFLRKIKKITSYTNSAHSRKQAEVKTDPTRLKFLDQEKELVDRQIHLKKRK